MEHTLTLPWWATFLVLCVASVLVGVVAAALLLPWVWWRRYRRRRLLQGPGKDLGRPPYS